MTLLFNLFYRINFIKKIDVLLYEQSTAIGYELACIHDTITLEIILDACKQHVPTDDVTADLVMYIREFLQHRLYYSESKSKFFFVPGPNSSNEEVYEVPENALRWAIKSIIRRTLGETAEYLFTDHVYAQLKKN
mgnify:CR=1 FL=1